ncbi:MAG TPA: acyl-CoA dehydrogenase family protein [Sandaracinaceae bacterium LLY-WYZ-13_1]|nr:acyl-CoA dehydrogenase family protein [Sandaracinaceae bacterium LLY-WYZ-13_1]
MNERRDPMDIVDAVAPALTEDARRHDAEGRFVAEGYRRLREHRFFSAGVPVALGGGGASHGALCEALRAMAHACPATALSASMHTHLVAAAVYKHRHGEGGEGLLRKVAEGERALVSTGAGDWLASNGRAERVDGGYRVSARKPFASGAPTGDLMITSVAHDDPMEGEVVLHFPVPLDADGVTVGDDWDAMGMRGTGSHTVALEGVFVPDEAIALRRPRRGWHPVWSVVLTVAAPIYTAVYVGVAEAARDRALELVRGGDAAHETMLAGEMDTARMAARIALDDLVGNAAEYDFEPALERANRALVGKSLAVDAAIRCVEAATELVGGRAYLTRSGLERLLRDVRAGLHHPLPPARQRGFTGRLALDLAPAA